MARRFAQLSLKALVYAVKTVERIEMMTTNLPKGSHLETRTGLDTIPTVSIPVKLLEVLLDSVGGSISLDQYDFLAEINGYLEVMQTEHPVHYRFRWVVK